MHLWRLTMTGNTFFVCVFLCPFLYLPSSPSRVCFHEHIDSCVLHVLDYPLTPTLYTNTHTHTHTHLTHSSTVFECACVFQRLDTVGINRDSNRPAESETALFFLPSINRRVCLIGFPVYLCQPRQKLHMCNFVRVCIYISSILDYSVGRCAY